MSPICGGWWVNKQYRLEPPLQLWRCIFLFVSHTLPIRILLLTCKKIEELRVSKLFSCLYKFSCFFDCILIILITYILISQQISKSSLTALPKWIQLERKSKFVSLRSQIMDIKWNLQEPESWSHNNGFMVYVFVHLSYTE